MQERGASEGATGVPRARPQRACIAGDFFPPRVCDGPPLSGDCCGERLSSIDAASVVLPDELAESPDKSVGSKAAGAGAAAGGAKPLMSCGQHMLPRGEIRARRSCLL